MESLSEAIEQAALARRADGKCEAHQHRVGLEKLRPFERQLQKAIRKIRAAASFVQLHDMIATRRTARVGVLTVYDTAVRVGAHLGIEPETVYLHAGTKKGARALGLPVKGGRLDPALLPGAMRSLTPGEAEDFLCIYKDSFSAANGRVRDSAPGQCGAPRRPRPRRVC